MQYRLSERDAQDINRRRHDFSAFTRTYGKNGNPGATGHVGHFGNAVRPGDIFPAMIVKVWDAGVNLQVHLDGNDLFWATSRTQGEDDGQWTWPPRVPEYTAVPASALADYEYKT